MNDDPTAKWYVAHTKPRQESLAQDCLQHAGLGPYLPLVYNRVYAGRSLRTIERPMFPHYLFVRCRPEPENWHTICTTRGIQSILGRNKPISVQDDAVDAVRIFEEECKARALGPRKRAMMNWKFRAGDKVRITKGPFAQFYAELTTAVDYHGRVKALVGMFARGSITELSAEALELVE